MSKTMTPSRADLLGNSLGGRLAARQHLAPVPARAGRRSTRKRPGGLICATELPSLSVLAGSAVGHYRGSFENRAMFTPVAFAAPSLAASSVGATDWRDKAHPVRDAIYALAGVTGMVATGFHPYNIGKRRDGFSWLNLFYSAPIGAPAALSLAGPLGFASERVRETPPDVAPRLLAIPAAEPLSH